mmetsp:Transcript_96119/g.277577  ORF Transcript_96119/g.277577 Transcript_96119/m.277577 type:complete len:595 (-) Transcript_96119:176-1960(-)
MDVNNEQQVTLRRVAPRPAEVRRRFDFRAFVPQRLNTQITRRYALDSREVGAGAFGKVFVAEDREVPGRKVAIKKFAITHKDMRSSFEREVSLMKELDHPNICKMYETYENGRTVWVVMEYCAGGEVFDRIQQSGGMDEREAANVIKQVALALKYAHGRSIAHRDLKPENVCYCDKDRKNDYVKVIDWGVGFHFNTAGMSSAVGSPCYTAPEVLMASDHANYTAACDLWSLGVMAYVMICGKPPFWGALQEQLKRMQIEKYPMSDSTWKATSIEARSFIRSLLKVDTSQRMQINQVLSHPWLAMPLDPSAASTDSATQKVLSNCRHFSKCDPIFSIVATNVAKQLDHHSLQHVRKVFVEMDTDCDGMLELREVVTGFERMYGKGSKEARGVEELFNRLDLDGSGKIDYTEFCAAGLGLDQCMTQGGAVEKELALRAAFKAFDVNDDNGRITRDEIQRVLQSADVGNLWSPEVVNQVTEEIFDRYDNDRNGYIDYQEFIRLMCDSRWGRKASGASLGEADESSDPFAPESTNSGVLAAVNHATSAGPTLLERRPLMNRLSSIGSSLKEAGRSKRLFGKVSDIVKKRPPSTDEVSL